METARLIVDLDALAANYRRFCPFLEQAPESVQRPAAPSPCAAVPSAAPVSSGRETATRHLGATANGQCGAVVKADAYGLGVGPVVETLFGEGCRDFFVATLDEGIAVRRLAAGGRVYVLAGPLDDADADTMADARLLPVLNDADQAKCWRARGPAAVHVDTGMNRLGFSPQAIDSETFAGMDVCLLMSHLANADEPSDPANARQQSRFEAVKALFPNVRTSFGNSAGALSGTESDLPRPGIALYGGNPFSYQPNPMRTVATLQSRVVALRRVPHGESVGYGGTYAANGDMRIAVLGIGYADGVSRLVSPRAEVVHGGALLPVVGRISMDLMQVDATAAEGIAVGDWVEIFGATVSIDDFAAWADTISYEVLTGIGRRVGRCYIGR